VNGLCDCDTQYTGAACDRFVECQYWDTTAETWSTQGCIASPPPSGRPDGYLHCNCTHLTDFGGVSFPTSADELLAETTSIQFTMFSLEDLSSAIGNFDPFANPMIFIVLMSVTIADVLMMCCNKMRGHRRTLKRGRAAAKRRKEARAVAREHARMSAINDPSVLELRNQRRQSTMGKLTLAEAEKKEKEKYGKEGKHPPIQDRIFLDLLDSAMFDPTESSAKARNKAAAKEKETMSKYAVPGTPDGTPPPSRLAACRPSIVDPLMADLLAPGEALPAVPSMTPEGAPVVPWAELLQQRMSSDPAKKDPLTSSCQSMMIQQRLPTRAHLQAEADGLATPPSRIGAPNTQGSTGAITLSRVSPAFLSTRIQCQARPGLGLGASPSAASPGQRPTTPSRLDALRRNTAGNDPGSGGGASSAPLQQRIPNFAGAAANRSRRLLSGVLTSPRSASQTPADGTPMRRVPSQAGLVRPRVATAEERAGALNPAAAPASPLPVRSLDYGSTQLPASASIGCFGRPSSAERRSGAEQRVMSPSGVGLFTEGLDDVSDSMPSAPPSPPAGGDGEGGSPQTNRCLGRVMGIEGSSSTHGSGRSIVSIGSPPTLEETIEDDPQFAALLHAVDDALGVTDASPAPAPMVLESAPSLHSSRMPQLSPNKRMQTSRMKLLPMRATGAPTLPPIAHPSAPVTDSAALSMAPSAAPVAEPIAEPVVDDLEAIRQFEMSLEEPVDIDAASAAATSEDIQSSRVPMVHKPADAAVVDASADENTYVVRALTACLREGGATDDGLPEGATLTVAPEALAPAPAADSDGASKCAALFGAAGGEGRRLSLKRAVTRASFSEEATDSEDLELAAFARKNRMSRLVGKMQPEFDFAERTQSMKKRAAETKAELKDTFSSPQAFVRHVCKWFTHCVRSLKKFRHDVWTVARSEHTLANAISPPEEDVLGDSLHDEQIIHIFWTIVMAELFMINMLSQNETESFSPLQILYLGFITSMGCAVAGKILKDIFKFGNKKRRRQSLYDKVTRAWRLRKKKRKQKRMEDEAAKKDPDRASRLSLSEPSRRPTLVRQKTSAALAKVGVVVNKQSQSFFDWFNVKKQMRRAKREARESMRGPLEEEALPAAVLAMQREAEREAAASVKIQSLMRQRQARGELQKRRTERNAVVSLQNAERSRTARKLVSERRVERKEQNDAASTLQKVTRGRRARQERREQNDAASTLQKVTRGRRARQERQEQNEAASTLQKVTRGRRARQERREQEAAAVTLQKVSRGRKSRREMDNAFGATTSASGSVPFYLQQSPPPSPPGVDAARSLTPGLGQSEKRIIRPNPFLNKLAASTTDLNKAAAEAAAAAPALPERSAPKLSRFKSSKAKAGASTPDKASACASPPASSSKAKSDTSTPKKGNESAPSKASGKSSKAKDGAPAPAALEASQPPKPTSGTPVPGGASSDVTFATVVEPFSTAAPVEGVRVEPAASGALKSNASKKRISFDDESGATHEAKGGGRVAITAWQPPPKPASGDAKRAGVHMRQASVDGLDDEADGRESKGNRRTTKAWEKVRAVQAIKRAQISVEQAERVRRSKLVPFSHKYVMFRWITCWVINLAVFVVLWLGNYTFGATFGVDVMNSVLIAWAAGLFQTFCIVEPAEVLGLVLLPSLAECSVIAKCRSDLKEYGFI